MSLALYRPSARSWAAVVILASWAGSLGWLGARELDRNESATLSSEAALRLAPLGAWYAVYAGATQVGTASITLDTLSPGYRIVQSEAVELPGVKGLLQATWRSETRLGPTLALEELHARYSRPGRPIDWTVSAAADSITAHSMDAAGRAGGRARLTLPPTAGAALTYRLAMAGSLAPGRARKLLVVDGWPLGVRQTAIAVGDDSTAVYADSSRIDPATGRWVAVRNQSARVASVTVDGVDGPYRLWVDHRGGVVGMTTLLGVRWLRTDFDIAVTQFRRDAVHDTTSLRQAWPVLVPWVSQVTARDSAPRDRVFIFAHRDSTPIDTALLARLAGGRQVVHADTVTILTDGVPIAGRAPDVAPDPLIQSEAAAMVAFARQFAGMDAEPRQLAVMIAALRRVVTVDTSATAAEDALGTLAAHRGRPDGVARLFVATARAIGMTARYVVGVVPHGDTLCTHAWAEVWVPGGRGWLPVDPVRGTAAASTSLIRLAYGGSSYPEDMLRLVANARLTELNTRGNP